MDSFADVWKAVCALLQERVTNVIYSIWLAPIEPVRFENDTAVLMVNSDFKRNIIIEKFMPVLVQAFTDVLGFPVEIDVLVNLPVNNQKEEPESSDGNAQSGFTFDNFIVGSSNRFAHAACNRVANFPGVEFNPLLIYGRSGLGKTHLMLAICNALKKRDPNAVIIYTTGEEFTNELIHHIAEKSTEVFHQKYRNVDALLVDDIQFIRSRISTQEEFFHTFNALTNAGKQIVLTSDRPPREMETLDDRLRTRFEMGLIADIQPPDIDTRIAIIRRKSQNLGLELSDSVVEYIAERVKNNIRQIEGSVKKLHALKQLHNINPTIEAAQDVIKDLISDSKPIGMTIEHIIEEVASNYGVSVNDIKSDKRNANISVARQVAMYIIRESTDLPLQNIGSYFGGKNHATVHHSVKQVENRMETDGQFKVSVNELMKNIEDNDF